MIQYNLGTFSTLSTIMIISVSHLSKMYKSHKRDTGFLGSVQSLFHRKHETIKAIDDISFSIDEGELVGFIGPNGAGKTTTLKCLSGLLYPEAGSIEIVGFLPFERKSNFLKQIALVMGQKNQLWWDLPVMETLLLNKEIYEIGDAQFQQTVEELSTLLDVADLLSIQAKKLSLGQRMKCELIAALIHSPKVLFLDEPTIGLDVVMQAKLRAFIKEYNQKYKATILLTSHYMRDVEELCERIIIIDHGKILFDGKLLDIVKKHAKHKRIAIVLKKEIKQSDLEQFGEVVVFEPPKSIISVPREKASVITGKLLKKFSVADIVIEEPDIEEVIRDVFREKKI